MTRRRHTIENLTDATPKVLWCRSIGHAWIPVTDFAITVSKDGRLIEYSQQVECANCGAVRIQTIGPDFEVKKSKITYPDGYLLSGHHARRAQVRAEVMRRGYQR